VGGIKVAYLVAGDITGVTYNSIGEITGITASPGTTIYTYEVQKQTSTLTETFNSSLENGTLFYSQELTLNFQKMDSQKRAQVKLMAQNRGLQGFAEDNNGAIYFLGADFAGGYLSSGSGTLGTAFGDANQYQVILTFFSKDPMAFLAGTLPQAVGGIVIEP
jgi:hypothetical protein